MITNLSFCFKGNRSYIHGTDIMNALLDYFEGKDVTKIDVKFHGVSSCNLKLIAGNELPNAKVNVSLFVDNEEKLFQMVENGKEIDCHYEYDEGSLISQCQLDLDNQQIHQSGVTGYSFYENFVAMNKHLLQSLYPEKQGKWYFTRIEQAKQINDDALITVKLTKNFNFRLTKSDILLKGEKLGSVYFTMVKE
ncbi:MAG: hypothetical protein KUG72_12220 [Pseudomonadales bacterium]|nr:hypothetical protein [Pseudomonadales bacterium]